MAIRLALLLLLPGLLAPPSAQAQLGRDFRFAWPLTPDVTGEDPAYDVDAQLVLVADREPVDVQVEGPGLSRTVSLAAGEVGTLRLPRDQAMVFEEDVPVAKGIRAWTTGCATFGALFRVPGSGASIGDDVARLLPVPLLGTRYLPVGYWGGAELVVVAVEDDTEVSITDPECGSPDPVTLREGEALLHRCVEAPEDADVTGTIVDASKPVAVMSGSESSWVVSHELPSGRAFWESLDVLLESPWPVDLLGREHVHVPFRRTDPEAPGDLLRLVAGCAGTLVTTWEQGAGGRNHHLETLGDHEDLEVFDALTTEATLVRGSARIESDRPAQVAAFTVGFRKAGIGDPSMTLLEPRERWEREALAWLPEGYVHSLGIAVPTSATDSVRLDGAALAGSWQPAGDGAGLSWLRLDDVPSGLHRVVADEPLAVTVSGYLPGDDHGAYSYPAIAVAPDGAAQLRISGVPPCDLACPGECVLLQAPVGLATHAWSTGGDGALETACPDETQEITLDATDASGCSFRGRVTVAVIEAPDAPEISGPDEVCRGECVTLTAPAGYESYAWDTGEETQSIVSCPDAPTTHRVVVSSPSGCGGEAEKLVTPHDPPVAGLARAEPLEDPCERGIEVLWTEATWRPGSPGGVYNLYRREGACADPDDPGWILLATALPGPPYVDRTVPAGVAHSYLVEAEDAPGGPACRPGPAWGGSTDATCASPGGVIDPGDPDAALLVSLSPHLRASGYEATPPPVTPLSVTFEWSRAPDLDPRTHVEVWRGDRPTALVPVSSSASGTSWTDAEPAGVDLFFYEVFNVTECGTRGE